MRKWRFEKFDSLLFVVVCVLCGAIMGAEARETQRVTVGDPVFVPITPESGYHLNWSPDSTVFAFARWTEGGGTAWVAPIGGGEAERLPIELSGDFYLSWSPDGSRLAFDAWDPGTDGPGKLWTIDVSGGGPTRILSQQSMMPDWSPDGERIVFCRIMASFDLFSVKTDGSDLRRHTFAGAADYHPDWSPDGRYLAFTSDRSGNNDIWIKPAAGGDAVQFTTDPAMDDRCRWSPDGAWLAFVSERSGQRNIWIKPVAGGDAIQITDGTGSMSMPTWSPDGRHLMYSGDETNGVWTVRIDLPTVARNVDMGHVKSLFR